MSCHPGLKSRYSYTLDQDCYLAENPRIFQDWFVLEKDQLLTKVASTGPVTWQREFQRGIGQNTQYMVT